MHDDRLKDESVARTEAGSADAEKALDARLIRALESVSEPMIPAGFAARVVSRLPAKRRPESLTPTRWGYRAMVMSMVVLAVVLVALAVRNVDHTVLGVTVEWIFCAQFLLLTVWFGLRRRERG